MRIYEFILESTEPLSFKRTDNYPDGKPIPVSLPPVYQLASNDDVPAGQHCGNCKHYDKETNQCDKFKGNPVVRPTYWCAKWESKSK
jgi:hypothetical protein